MAAAGIEFANTDIQCQNRKSCILHTFAALLQPLIFQQQQTSPKKKITCWLLPYRMHTLDFSTLFLVRAVCLLASMNELVARYLNFHRHVKTLRYCYCYYSHTLTMMNLNVQDI